MIQGHEYDILLFTETWLNNEITDGMLLNDTYYNLFRLDRILYLYNKNTWQWYILIYIYINSLFPAHILQFTENFELINLLVFYYTIIVIYRPPSISYNDIVKLFDLISKLTDTIRENMHYLRRFELARY